MGKEKIISQLKGLSSYFGFFLIFFMQAGCEKSLFFGEEPEISISFQLPHFHEISVDDIFEIELTTDTVYSIKLTGNRKIIENIAFDVTNSVLKLKDKNSLQWLPDYPVVKLSISFPDIRQLSLNEPSRIFSRDTLQVTNLKIFANGILNELDLTVNTTELYLTTRYEDFGYYRFNGYSKNANINIYGSAQVNAAGLRTGTSRIRNLSTGDCHIHAISVLRVWLEHYGNIYYSGNPEQIIVESMESTGRLIKSE